MVSVRQNKLSDLPLELIEENFGSNQEAVIAVIVLGLMEIQIYESFC